MKQLADSFNTRTEASQRAYQEQINFLTQQQQKNQESFQSQVQLLIDSHIKISKETIIAVKALENTVQVMQREFSTMRQIKDEK